MYTFLCKNCYVRKKRKNINNFVPEKQNNDNKVSCSASENHPYDIICPSNFGKTSYTLKILEKIGSKKFNHITT